jgi:hypothetical protein
MSDRKYLPLDEDGNEGIGSQRSALSKKPKESSFITRHAGAFFATPFMLFNAVTTVAGVTLILPAASGLPIGIFLSTTYILVTISDKIKREHPLRRLVLLYIFAICSAYTSFFSIYQEMSDVKLEYQAVEKTVDTHNDFINNLRVSLNKEISELAAGNPNIDKVKRLNEELEKITEQRAKFDREGKDKAAGELAGRIKYTKRNIESLMTSMEASPNFRFHEKLVALQTDKKETLKSSLSVQTFIDSKQSPSELFARDASLYRDIFAELESTNKDAGETNFGKTNKAPKYDNYLKTPIFLIPFESLVGSANRQLTFMGFAILISILMEIIPLLLSGIISQEEEEPEAELPNQQLSLPPHDHQERDLLFENAKTVDVVEVTPVSSRTPLTQASKLVSTFVFDIKKLSLEIYQSLSRGVGTADNVKSIVDRKLHQSMASAHLHTLEEQYTFLVLFYESIHRDELEISLSNFPDGNNLDDEFFRYKMAAALFISVMRDKRIGWLKKSSKDETFHKDVNKIGGEFGTDSFVFPELFAQRKSKIKKWQFVNEAAYQDFLDWWLKQQHNKDSTKIAEELKSNLNVVLGYTMANRNNNNHKGVKSDRE